GVAAAALGVEREHAGGDAVQLGGGRRREQLADLVPRLDVRRRIRPRGAPDRRLIDQLHVVDLLDAFQRRRADVQTGRAAEFALVAVVQTIADERRFAGAGDAGHRDELAEGDVDVDAFE